MSELAFLGRMTKESKGSLNFHTFHGNGKPEKKRFLKIFVFMRSVEENEKITFYRSDDVCIGFLES